MCVCVCVYVCVRVCVFGYILPALLDSRTTHSNSYPNTRGANTRPTASYNYIYLRIGFLNHSSLVVYQRFKYLGPLALNILFFGAPYPLLFP